MNYETLLISVNDRIAFVTINRTEKLNALNAQCRNELKTLFTDLRVTHDVDAVILTGAGDKAFVAGVDISEMATLNAHSAEKFASSGQSVFDLIHHLGKPVIAAVNGHALGGGCELAMACHIRIASENATFGQTEVNLGVIPGYGGTQRLARIIGIGRAMEMILTGRRIDAREALSIGLISSVVPFTELIPAAEAVARMILSKGQAAIHLALKAVSAATETPLSEGLKIEAKCFGECFNSQDAKEGITAFLQKRKPLFKGK